jgi:hypothetical protein
MSKRQLAEARYVHGNNGSERAYFRGYTDSRSNTTTELVVAHFWPAIDEKTVDE